MAYLWLVLGLLSAFTAALVAIFGKLGLQNLDSTTATAIRAVVMTVFLVLVVVLQGKLSNVSEILASKKAMLYIVLSGVAGALSWLFYFWALKVGKASQIVPIDRLSVVFALVLAAIFLGEALTWKTGVGAVLIVAGAIFVALA